MHRLIHFSSSWVPVGNPSFQQNVKRERRRYSNSARKKGFVSISPPSFNPAHALRSPRHCGFEPRVRGVRRNPLHLSLALKQFVSESSDGGENLVIDSGFRSPWLLSSSSFNERKVSPGAARARVQILPRNSGKDEVKMRACMVFSFPTPLDQLRCVSIPSL